MEGTWACHELSQKMFEIREVSLYTICGQVHATSPLPPDVCKTHLKCLHTAGEKPCLVECGLDNVLMSALLCLSVSI